MPLQARFPATAEAVFGYLLQESGLAERARAVLGRDPERRAFQTALAGAYVAFAHQGRPAINRRATQATPRERGWIGADATPSPVQCEASLWGRARPGSTIL